MRGKTVLIVEDNPLNLELVSDLLRLAGCEVIEATNAEEGLASVVAILPDLVLLDIRLPGMDGLQAVRRLRQDSRTTGIPIVALTAQAMRGDERMALEAGFTGYITKPIDTRSFVAEVKRFLRSPMRGEPGGAA